MKKIIEVLRLKYEARLSHEKIARAWVTKRGQVLPFARKTQDLTPFTQDSQ